MTCPIQEGDWVRWAKSSDFMQVKSCYKSGKTAWALRVHGNNSKWVWGPEIANAWERIPDSKLLRRLDGVPNKTR